MDCSRWCVAIFLAYVIGGTDGVRGDYWSEQQFQRSRRQSHLLPVISNHPNGATSISGGSGFLLSQPVSAGVATPQQHHQQQQQRPIFHVNLADNTAHFLPATSHQQQDSSFQLRQGQPHFLLQRPLTPAATTNNQRQHHLPPLPPLPIPRGSPPVVHQFGQSHIQQPQQQQRPTQQQNFPTFFTPFDQFEFDFNEAQRGQQSRPLFRPLTSFPPPEQQQRQPQDQQFRPSSNASVEDYDYVTDFTPNTRPPTAPQPSLTNINRRPSPGSNFRPRPEEEDFVNDIRFPGPPDGQPQPPPPSRRPSGGDDRRRPSSQPERRPVENDRRPLHQQIPPQFDRFPERPPPRDPFQFNQDPFFFHRPPPASTPSRPLEEERRPTPASVEEPRQRPTQRPATERPSNGRGSSRFRPSDFDGDVSSVTEEQQQESQPLGPTDSTETFGIPPPADDFGSKLEEGAPQPPRRPISGQQRPALTTTTRPSTSTRHQQPFFDSEPPSSSPFPLHPPFHTPSRGQLRPVPRPVQPEPQRPSQFFPQNRPLEVDDFQRPDLSFSNFFPGPPRGPPRGIQQQRPQVEIEEPPPPPRGPPRGTQLRPQVQIEEQQFTEQPPRGPSRGPQHRPQIEIEEQEFSEPPPPRGPSRGSQRRPQIEFDEPQFSEPPPPRRRPPQPSPTASTEIDDGRRPFVDDFRPRPPPSRFFPGDHPPTFGPQSVDQLQPPDIAPFTPQPFDEEEEEFRTPRPTTTSTSTLPPSTTTTKVATTVAPTAVKQPVRQRVTSGRVRSRTRRPIGTTQGSESVEVTSPASPPKRRFRPGAIRTSTEQPVAASSAAPRRRIRPINGQQRAQRVQRKNITKTVVQQQDEEVTPSAVVTQAPRRTTGVSRSQIAPERKPSVTRMVIKRRRPITTTTTPKAQSDEVRHEQEHSFTDHQLSPSRRKVSIVSKLDADNNRNHHHQVEGGEDAHIEASHEKSSVTEAAPKVKDHSEGSKLSVKITKHVPKTTSKSYEPSTTSTVATTATTSISTTASPTPTPNASLKETTEPEALNKLRNLLNRKFVFKPAPQSPTK